MLPREIDPVEYVGTKNLYIRVFADCDRTRRVRRNLKLWLLSGYSDG